MYIHTHAHLFSVVPDIIVDSVTPGLSENLVHLTLLCDPLVITELYVDMYPGPPNAWLSDIFYRISMHEVHT